MEQPEKFIHVSKTKVGKPPLHYETFCLNELMAEMKTYAEKELEKVGRSNVKVEIFKDWNKRNWVHSDRKCLKQILSILLDNAVKHTDSGAFLFDYNISSLSHDVVYFFVDDTGNGVYNENDTNMSIAKGLIEQLGGELEVRPEGEAGTAVSFNIVCMPFNLQEN